ncbi:2423_t:CDS:2, partial [Racocetra fulgida]
DTSNSLLPYTSNVYNLFLFQINNDYASFTNDIMTSEGILNDFSEQLILENTYDDIDKFNKENEFDFKDKAEFVEPTYSLTMNQTFQTWEAVDKYYQLTKEMQDNIRLLASCSVQASVIIEVLQQKYPKKYIHLCNVYNIVQTIHYKKHVAGDAGSTYLELIKNSVMNLVTTLMQ